MAFVDHGRTFDGWDCYGLVRAGFEAVAGIVLPAFDTVAPDDGGTAGARIAEQSAMWLPVDLGQERAMDVAVMRGHFKSGSRIVSADCHVGLVLRPKWLLHAERGVGTVTVSMSHPSIRNRLTHIYRHRDLA